MFNALVIEHVTGLPTPRSPAVCCIDPSFAAHVGIRFGFDVFPPPSTPPVDHVHSVVHSCSAVLPDHSPYCLFWPCCQFATQSVEDPLTVWLLLVMLVCCLSFSLMWVLLVLPSPCSLWHSDTQWVSNLAVSCSCLCGKKVVNNSPALISAQLFMSSQCLICWLQFHMSIDRVSIR